MPLLNKILVQELRNVSFIVLRVGRVIMVDRFIGGESLRGRVSKVILGSVGRLYMDGIANELRRVNNEDTREGTINR